MADRIQIRRDTASNWTAANPTPAAGEICYESDTGKLKIGNGTSSWTSLVYTYDLSILGYSRVWTDAVTVVRTDNDTVVYTTASAAIATLTANSIIGRLVRWMNGDGSAIKKAFVRNATTSGADVVIELSGDIFAAGGATSANSNLASFRVSLHETVRVIDWYIPGEQIADNAVATGKIYFNRTNQSWHVISTSAYLGTAGNHAAGTGVMTYNIYNGANAIFSTAPDLVETAALDNSVPDQNNPIAGGSKISLRTITVTADTTKPQDLCVTLFYAFSDLWSAV